MPMIAISLIFSLLKKTTPATLKSIYILKGSWNILQEENDHGFASVQKQSLSIFLYAWDMPIT